MAIMPFFSIVIPTFNRGELLREALHSVFAQEFTDYEAIVVDDGSTEDIEAVTREFAGRVKYLRQENRGPGAARNLGIANAVGEYIAFLDCDDQWFPWTLAVYHTVMEQCASPTAIAGCLRQFEDAGDLRGITQEPLEYDRFDDYLSAGRCGLYVGAGQLLARRDALTTVGGFSVAHGNGEDHDLALRMGDFVGFVHVRAPAMVAYRQHPGSETTNVSKTLIGVQNLLRREKAGSYAGGTDRRLDRRQVLTTHVRPLTLAALNVGAIGPAWALYTSTFAWHLRQRRWKYLLGFPAQVAIATVKHTIRGKTVRRNT